MAALFVPPQPLGSLNLLNGTGSGSPPSSPGKSAEAQYPAINNKPEFKFSSQAPSAGLAATSAESPAGSGPFGPSTSAQVAPTFSGHKYEDPSFHERIPAQLASASHTGPLSASSTHTAPYRNLDTPQPGLSNGSMTADNNKRLPSPLVPACPPSDHKHLFHAYIYDYLFKQGFTDAARAFLVNAPDTPTKDPSSHVYSRIGLHAKESASRPPGSGVSPPPPLPDHQESLNGLRNGDASHTSGMNLVETSDPSRTSGGVTSPPGPHLERITDDMADEEEDERREKQKPTSTAQEDDQIMHIKEEKTRSPNKPGTSSSENSNESSSFGDIRAGNASSKDSAQTSASATSTAATSIHPDSNPTESLVSLDRRASGGGSDGHHTPPPISHPMKKSQSDSSINNSFTPKTTTSSTSSRNHHDQLAFNESSQLALPQPDISIVAPQGFLYEWWTVFWDVFRARGDKGGSPAARAFAQADTYGLVGGPPNFIFV